MLEKVFGKKSTGIVYIVCAGVLLLALAGNVVSFMIDYPDSSLYSLFVQALLTAVSIISISAPVFIQKRFRFYIPPFIEICLCIYALLLFFLSRYYAGTIIVNSFLPAAGGFTISMLLFAVIYSALSKLAQSRQKDPPTLKAAACTLGAAFALMLILAALFSLAAYIADTPPMTVSLFMVQSAHFLLGSLLFCLTGYFAARSHGERFRIRSFKNPKKAAKVAVEKKNRSLYAVVKNLSSDKTDYQKAFRRAKAGYYLVRIIYIAAYAGYIVHACFVFSKLGGLGIAIIFFLVSSFLFTAALYVYEYFMFRKGAVNQRLRKLKISKTVARSYALLLILIAMYVADYNYNRLSAFLSVGMLLFNLCLMFYNIFGKPRYYPSAKAQGRSGAAPEPLQAAAAEAPGNGSALNADGSAVTAGNGQGAPGVSAENASPGADDLSAKKR